MAAMAVCVLASCSKEHESVNTGSGEQAKLKITVTNPSLQPSRAAGAASTTDNTVVNYNVFVVDQSGAIPTGWSGYFVAATDGTTATLSVSTLAKKVYVVANAGDLTSSLTSETAILAAQQSLAGQFTARWATGSTSAISWTTVGTTTSGTATAALDFIAARITLTVVNTMNGYGTATLSTPGVAGTLNLNSVAVLNAGGESKLFPTSPSTSLIPSVFTTAAEQYLSGIVKPVTAANWPAAGAFTAPYAALTDSYSTTVPATVTYHYYVYENSALTAATFPTIVTLSGLDGAGAPVYFPVHLAAYEQFSTGTFTTASVLRGHSYNITVTLNGDATDGGNGGGTTDPTTPSVLADVDVTISINDWTPVTLGKEFGN